MKRTQTLLIAGVIALFGGLFILSQPVLAEEELQCSILPQDICNQSDEGELTNSGIWRLLLMAINILTVGIGIVAVAAIVYAGFLYATAQSDAGQTKKAIEMIRNTVIGLIVYALMFAGANFLIPGGIFTGSASSGTGPCGPGAGQECQ